MNRMEWSTRGGGLTEIVTEASWREIGKVLETSYSGWRVKIRNINYKKSCLLPGPIERPLFIKHGDTGAACLFKTDSRRTKLLTL